MLIGPRHAAAIWRWQPRLGLILTLVYRGGASGRFSSLSTPVARSQAHLPTLPTRQLLQPGCYCKLPHSQHIADALRVAPAGGVSASKTLNALPDCQMSLRASS